MRIRYNKLVRDRIPELLEEWGKDPRWRTETDKKKLLCFMRVKVAEEAQELSDAKGEKEIKEELADVIEIIEAFIKTGNYSKKELRAIRSKKNKARGAFTQGYILISANKK